MLHVPSSPVDWALYLLAAYGLFALAVRSVRLFRRLRCAAAPPPAASVLLLVRNQAHQIEGVLRSLGNILLSHRRDARFDLVVVDHCSTDETPQIIERLARSMPGIRLVQITDQVCRGQAACEVGLFACHSRVVLLLDLMGAGEVRPSLETIATLMGTRCPWWM